MTDIARMTDLELLLGWRHGDAKLGAQLFERHKTAVTNLFRRNVRSKEAIPDLVQQTFLACIDARSDPQISGSVRSYILGIAFHTMTRFFRKERKAPVLEVEVHDEEESRTSLASIEPDPEYLLTLSDEQRLLMKALRRLTIEFQAVIELNYWEGVSCDEIAVMLGIPQGTARRRLQRGREALEKKLEELSDSPELLRSTTMSLRTWQRSIHEWIATRPDAPGRSPPN